MTEIAMEKAKNAVHIVVTISLVFSICLLYFSINSASALQSECSIYGCLTQPVNLGNISKNITNNYYQMNLSDVAFTNRNETWGDNNVTALWFFGYIDWANVIGKITLLSELVNDLGYTHLSNFTDDLGDRGYTSLSNFTDDVINNTGLVKDWNSTGLIANWSTTDLNSTDLNSTGLIINWSYVIAGATETDPYWSGNMSLFAKIIDLVGYVGNWTLDKVNYLTKTETEAYINANISTANTSMKGYVDGLDTATNTSMKGYVDGRDAVTNLHTHDALNITNPNGLNNKVLSNVLNVTGALPTAGGTMTGNINMSNSNITISQGYKICTEQTCTHYIIYNGTATIWV